eukprot:1175964-Prorocentrum_minimum.AAC.3
MRTTSACYANHPSLLCEPTTSACWHANHLSLPCEPPCGARPCVSPGTHEPRRGGSDRPPRWVGLDTDTYGVHKESAREWNPLESDRDASTRS